MVVMPILFCLRAFPFDPIQSFAGSLMTKFYPLVLTTVPVAILFRISAEILDASTRIGGASYITPIFAIMTLILAAILPKLTFQFSGQIQRSVRSASTVARGAAGQATTMASGGGAAQQTLGGETVDPAAMGDSGGSRGSSTMSASSQSSRDSLRHEAELDFTRRGRRRRQMERGAKGVKAAAKAGKKTASAAKKGSLGALSGAAKAHEKGKQSEMPTSTATAGAAAWQTGEAAKSKAEDITSGASSSIRSGWEDRIKKRVQNAREAGQSTVEQARQEARESRDWNDDDDGDDPPPGGTGAPVQTPTDSQEESPESEVNTAPGEPAMDATQSTSTEAFEETEADTPAADAGSPDLTTGAVSQGETYDRNASDTAVGGFASSASTSSTTVDATEDDNSSTPSESVSPESMVDATGDGTHTVDEQQAEQVAANIAAETNLWELGRENQDEPIYDELGIKDSPEGKEEYTAVQATRHKLREQADNKGEIPYSDRNSPGGTNEYTFDSSGGDAGGSTETVDSSAGLSDTEQAVQTHLETNGKSPDEVSHAALAGEMMGNDQIDDPGDVKDALDTLRNPDK
jgi:hypothetical protein